MFLKVFYLQFWAFGWTSLVASLNLSVQQGCGLVPPKTYLLTSLLAQLLLLSLVHLIGLSHCNFPGKGAMALLAAVTLGTLKPDNVGLCYISKQLNVQRALGNLRVGSSRIVWVFSVPGNPTGSFLEVNWKVSEPFSYELSVLVPGQGSASYGHNVLVFPVLLCIWLVSLAAQTSRKFFILKKVEGLFLIIFLQAWHCMQSLL